MARAIAARLQAAPGWKVIRYARINGKFEITTHYVAGWGLEPQEVDENGIISFRGIPISIGGEDMTNHPNHLGVIGPNEDFQAKIATYERAINIGSESSPEIDSQLEFAPL